MHTMGPFICGLLAGLFVNTIQINYHLSKIREKIDTLQKDSK